MEFLVGYTGFVGSNLVIKHNFDGLFNSKNIKKSYGKNPDLLVYSGVPAQKFIANSNPIEDMKIINNAIENIKKINPKKLVLISTIDVYETPFLVDEDNINASNEPYGKNRLYLEEWVEKNINDYLIIRLPALYGENLKKNFIYDLIHLVPSMLKEDKYLEILKLHPKIKNYYQIQDTGFYKCKKLSSLELLELKELFKNIGFTALNFTDSRSKFQFYNLSNLWHDINLALENNIKKLNIATEPIGVSELYTYIYPNKNFKNEILNNMPNYNFKTKYFKLFGGKNGYIQDKESILKDIKEYVNSEIERLVNL